MWGCVQGGMGIVSFYFCDAAREKVWYLKVANRSRQPIVSSADDDHVSGM